MGAIVLASSLMLLKDFLHGWWWERGCCRGSSLLMLVPSLEAERSVAKARKHAVQDSSGFSRCKQRELSYKHKCTLPRHLGMEGHIMLTTNEQEVSTPGMDLTHRLQCHPGVSHTLTLAASMPRWYLWHSGLRAAHCCP